MQKVFVVAKNLFWKLNQIVARLLTKFKNIKNIAVQIQI